MRFPCKIIASIFALSLICFSNKAQEEKMDNNQLWLDCKLEGVISFDIFNTALTGLHQIENQGKKNIVSIIDFTRPSTERRLFVIDLEHKILIYKCYVAHGRNSGDNYAKSFSNDPASLKSSLGFFLTAETYSGDHGYSLKLDGLEKGINDNAREREIVIHGAEYVSDDFIKKYGRIGRSWGCPAIPVEISKEIIDKIAGGSCLYIHSDDNYYKENSVFLKRK
jgi:L,D-transpeptidase catalytic domain